MLKRSTPLYREVARRYLRATQFDSDEALKDYLSEHPGADKSKHHVVEHGGEADHGDHGEAPKKSLKDRLKGMSEKTTSFLKSAPAQVQKFFSDDSFRRKTLQDTHKALMDAPGKLAKSALDTARHEVKEFKEAGASIRAVMKGGKMNDHQKKAFKAVATHMAISIAAAALTASGPLAAAGAVGKGLAKHVAMKSVSNALGHLHVLEELGHVGHGIQHVISKLAAEEAEQGDPDRALSDLVVGAVAKEIDRLSDDDILGVVEEHTK